MLIREIQVWSVVRTIFPLGWIISTLIIFSAYLLVGSLLTNLANEFTETPVFDSGISVAVGIVLSILLGFLSTVATTLLAVVVVVVYNFLAALGGGVSVRLTEPTPGKSGAAKVEEPGAES